jgi:hypothetical protein
MAPGDQDGPVVLGHYRAVPGAVVETFIGDVVAFALEHGMQAPGQLAMDGGAPPTVS